MYIVVTIRLLIPYLILINPFVGGILSGYVDIVDWEFLRLIGQYEEVSYQTTDKFLDIYYMTLEAGMLLRWENLLAKNVAFSLFIYRFVGVFLFELFGTRELLLVFPNIFELFFLLHEGLRFFKKKEPSYSIKSLVSILFLLVIPKLIQEYLLHYQK